MSTTIPKIPQLETFSASNPNPISANQPNHPSNADTAPKTPTLTTYLQKIGLAAQDVYTIHLADPTPYRRPDCFKKGTVLAFSFQRYHCNPVSDKFHAIFPEDVTLVLKVQRFRTKRGRSGGFPYLLDVSPEISFYTDLCRLSYTDPILLMLNPNLRMTFRYKPEEGLGFLVHLGYDWPDADETSRLARWRTAFNLRRFSSP